MYDEMVRERTRFVSRAVMPAIHLSAAQLVDLGQRGVFKETPLISHSVISAGFRLGSGKGGVTRINSYNRFNRHSRDSLL